RLSFFFFFFQAEDGIRDFHVTGVQTCALPIFDGGAHRELETEWFLEEPADPVPHRRELPGRRHGRILDEWRHRSPSVGVPLRCKIGRASCRGRVWITGVAVSCEYSQSTDEPIR